jgi:lysophospholipase L1-like esterase
MPPFLTTLIPIGDSVIAHDSEDNSSNYALGTYATGFIAYANAALQRPFLVPYNAGVSGTRTDQWISGGQVAAALALKPGMVLIGPPTNDLLQGVSLATIQANIAAIVASCAAAAPQIPVILMAALPNSNYTSGEQTVRRQYNVWLRDTIWRSTKNLYFFDPNRWVEDPTTGQWASGMSSDGTHPNVAGGVMIGEALATWFAGTPLYSPPPTLWTHTGDDQNLLSNGIPTGSGGTAGTGTTGTVATSWTTTRLSGAGTATASVVARSDLLQGKAQRLVIASGAGTSVFYYQQQISLPTVGKYVYGEAEVKPGGDWVSPNRLYMAMAFAGGTGGFTVWDLRQVTADAAFPINPSRTYKFRTPAVQVPTGPTALQLQVFISADSGTCDLLGGAVRYANVISTGPV